MNAIILKFPKRVSKQLEQKFYRVRFKLGSDVRVTTLSGSSIREACLCLPRGSNVLSFVSLGVKA